MARRLLLGDGRDLREGGGEAAGDQRVGELVGLGDRRGVGLGADVEVGAAVDLHDRRAGLEREAAEGGDDGGVIHGILLCKSAASRQGMDRAARLCKHRAARERRGRG